MFFTKKKFIVFVNNKITFVPLLTHVILAQLYAR